MHLHEFIVFTGFLVLVLFLLFLDIGVFNKKSHEVSFREALGYTVLWVSLALVFWGLIYFFGDKIHAPQNLEELQVLVERYSHPIHLTDNFEESLGIYRRNLGLEFITGYLIEYSLSVDNIFVMLMIFYSFGVQKKYYHRVLFWGILGAIVMRFLFIFVSSALIQHFSWVLYLFGALLVFTGIKMFLDRNKQHKIDTNSHPVIRFVSRYFLVDDSYQGSRFFIRKDGRTYITGLFVVVLVIEFTDVIFAIDSVPAIFSITKDPFIVYFSNIFAIIGLRSLFFLVMNLVEKFRYLKVGLAVLLIFIGMKMLLHHWLPLTTMQSLTVVLGILVVSILFSVVFPGRRAAP
ncbi:MAG: TerC/Alx family metal homeostasis membrane protein [Bacteroidales bacterium]|nr:TerC/Alx family metal homeostasis membrane protein [Bacteroidales bacterium]MCF6342053.1 TerC/Alx family metal homeostasis membrane protein [Bacteroidales bacterium]